MPLTEPLSFSARRKIAKQVRKLLADRFPAAFAPKGQPKRPLKIQINKDIRAALPEVSRRELGCALADYTGGPTYLRAMVAGAARIDLQGEPAGKVTDAQAERAAARLAGLEKRFAAEEQRRAARRAPLPVAA